jgi:hypothetical protein
MRDFITRTHHQEKWYDQVKDDEMDRACSTHGYERNVYRILAGKAEGERPLGRPRQSWEDNIKMDYRKDGVVWTGLIRLRTKTSGGCL